MNNYFVGEPKTESMNNSIPDTIIILYLSFIVTIYNDLVLMHEDLMSESQAVENISLDRYSVYSLLYFT